MRFSGEEKNALHAFSVTKSATVPELQCQPLHRNSTKNDEPRNSVLQWIRGIFLLNFYPKFAKFNFEKAYKCIKADRKLKSVMAYTREKHTVIKHYRKIFGQMACHCKTKPLFCEIHAQVPWSPTATGMIAKMDKV